MKEKVQHREREGRARVWVLEKFYYYYYFFKILLMWKIVGASKALVLYVYIDNNLSNLCKKKIVFGILFFRTLNFCNMVYTHHMLN